MHAQSILLCVDQNEFGTPLPPCLAYRIAGFSIGQKLAFSRNFCDFKMYELAAVKVT